VFGDENDNDSYSVTESQLLQSDGTSTGFSDATSLQGNHIENFQFKAPNDSETPIRDNKPAHLTYAQYYWTLSLENRDAYMQEFKDLSEILIYHDNFLNYDEVSLFLCCHHGVV